MNSNSVLVPLIVYLLSAGLLLAETAVLGRALERIRETSTGFTRRLAVFLLVLPLVLVPFVPLVFMFTLEPSGKANLTSVYYVGVLWLLGVLAVVPYYIHILRCRRTRPPSEPRHRGKHRHHRVVNESAAGDGLSGMRIESED